MTIKWLLSTLMFLLVFCSVAAEFSVELPRIVDRVRDNPETLAVELDRLTRSFPVAVDWMNQLHPRPQLDREGRSKSLHRYLTHPNPNTMLHAGIESAAKELGKAGTAYLDQASRLLSEGIPGHDARWLQLFVAVCEDRRQQRLESLRSESPRVLFVKRRTVRPSFYGYTEGQSDGQREKHFLPGSSLCVLDLSSGRPVVETLLDDPEGVIRDPDVSFDGQRILFAWKKGPRIEDDDYHLYEMNLLTRKIRQLTRGKGVADYEGRYLPSGDLVFASTRCVQTVDCFVTEVSNLYTCDRDGRFIRRLGYDQVHTTYPNVLNDGRIVYTRWDYNDRGQVYPQPLFQMNPDGTAQTEYYGNNSWFPTTISHARAIPGSSKLVTVLMGHHSWQAGKLALIDRNKGTQEAEGVQLIAPVRETRAVRVDAYGQDEELFRHPYALDEKRFLVAMTPDHRSRHNNNTRFGLYYIEADGKRELLVYDHQISCAHPVALRTRPRPPVRPSSIDFSSETGTYFMQDVYTGPGLAGVPRGTIKKLRVVALEFRAAPVGVVQSSGEAGGSHTYAPIACGNASWDTKVILGETPIHEDGSAMFEVPANTPLYFQCVDADGQVAATMRSWSTLMPGETFGCVGCHEDKSAAPPPGRPSLAMKAGVAKLAPFYDVSGKGFSFPKTIQPILDQHCVSCHDGSPQADGTLLSDLSDKPVAEGSGGRKWSAAYLALTGTTPDQQTKGNDSRKILNWISTQSRPSMLPPYHAGSATSDLVKMLREGHGDTRLSREEIDKFCAWIDLAVPFCGDYLEANTWNDHDLQRYLRYQRKRERYEADDRHTRERLHEQRTGQRLVLPVPPPRFADAVKATVSPQAKVGP